MMESEVTARSVHSGQSISVWVMPARVHLDQHVADRRRGVGYVFEASPLMPAGSWMRITLIVTLLSGVEVPRQPARR